MQAKIVNYDHLFNISFVQHIKIKSITDHTGRNVVYILKIYKPK